MLFLGYLNVSNRNDVIELLRLMRIHSASASGFIPVLVALFFTRDLLILIGLFVMGALAHIVIFTMNECVDIEVDKLNVEIREKPLIKGSITLQLANTLWVVLLIIAFLFYFIYFFTLDIFTNMSFNIYGGIVLFSISILIFMLYNIYGKYLKGKDILLSLGVFFLALMAPGLLITSFNQLLPAVLLSLYFMLEFVVTTDLGDIKDVEVETRLKSKTPPVVFGVRVKDNKITYPIRFKAYVYSLRILMVAVLAIFIIQQNIGIESIGIVFIVLFVIISIGSLAIITKLFGDNVFDRRKLLVRIGINELMTFNAVPLVVLAVLDVEAVSRLVILAIVVLAPMIWLKLFLRVSYKDIVPIT